MLTIFGTVSLDTIRAPGGSYADMPGGSAIYAAISASRFTRPRLVGRGGRGIPRPHIKMLHTMMDTGGLSGMDGGTFRYEARYLDDHHRKDIRTEFGIPEGYRHRVPDEYRGSGLVCLANEDPGQQLRVLEQFDGPNFVMCDTINYWIRNKRDDVVRVFGSVDTVIINDGEAGELTGCRTTAQCARIISGWGAEHVVIKRGGRGSILFSGGREFPLPAYPLDGVADPTGAGDAFAGAVMGYLARVGSADLRSLRRACIYGNVMGSLYTLNPLPV